jgi:membrane protein implicated in regulation of membrane protease activity
MYAWSFWIGAAVVLGLAEILTLGLFLAPFALGALAAAALAALGVGASASLAAFAVASLLLMFTVRPLVLARVRPAVGIRTGAAALIGARGVVVERIAVGSPGLVKLNGEVWTARGYAEDGVIEPGTLVDVLEIRGATALVSE